MKCTIKIKRFHSLKYLFLHLFSLNEISKIFREQIIIIFTLDEVKKYALMRSKVVRKSVNVKRKYHAHCHFTSSFTQDYDSFLDKITIFI